jgi:hypothetical protein
LTAPLIVTALMGDGDFAWADGLRRAHFPPDRNLLRAHVTLFHQLPPSAEDEARTVLKTMAREPPPPARLGPPFSLGRGVAYRIDSPALEAIRAELAGRFAGLLSAQDRQGWRPHVTVQNKVEPAEAKALLAALSADHMPRAFAIVGLALWRYLGGPWESVGAWRFGSGHAMTPPC